MRHRDQRPSLASVMARARAKWAAKVAAGGTAVAVTVGVVAFVICAVVVGAVSADVGISHGWFKSPQQETAAADTTTKQDDAAAKDGASSDAAKTKTKGKAGRDAKTRTESDIDSWGDPEADNVVNYEDIFGPDSSDGQSDGQDGQDGSGTSVQQGDPDDSSQGGDWTRAYK